MGCFREKGLRGMVCLLVEEMVCEDVGSVWWMVCLLQQVAGWDYSGLNWGSPVHDGESVCVEEGRKGEMMILEDKSERDSLFRGLLQSTANHLSRIGECD